VRPGVAVGVLFWLLLGLLLARTSTAGTEDPILRAAVDGKTYVFAEFVSRTCPACEEMRPLVQQALARHPRVMHQVHDADVAVELARKYEIRCVPVYVVVDPQGQIRFNDVGLRTGEELEEILRSAGVGPD